MGAETNISWTHSTWNGWIGCTRHGEGCRHCYAEMQNRFYKWNGGEWGPGALRKVTSPANWLKPLKWNREAKAAGERKRVFGFSLADWADAEGPEGALPWLWALWRATPWLDWQMLTKRAERIAQCLPPDWGDGYPNVQLGYSIACQDDVPKVAELLKVPAAVHFLSCEPLIGPVDLDLRHECRSGSIGREDHSKCGSRIDWVICGGESGGEEARPMHLSWPRSIIEKCRATSTPVFMKQIGVHPQADFYSNDDSDQEHFGERGHEWTPDGWNERDGQPALDALVTLKISKKLSAQLEEMPPDLRIRQFPKASR